MAVTVMLTTTSCTLNDGRAGYCFCLQQPTTLLPDARVLECQTFADAAQSKRVVARFVSGAERVVESTIPYTRTVGFWRVRFARVPRVNEGALWLPQIRKLISYLRAHVDVRCRLKMQIAELESIAVARDTLCDVVDGIIVAALSTVVQRVIARIYCETYHFRCEILPRLFREMCREDIYAPEIAFAAVLRQMGVARVIAEGWVAYRL